MSILSRTNVRVQVGWIWVALFAACMLFGCKAPLRAHGAFLDRQVEWGGRDYRFKVFVPASAAAGSKPAVIVFLHGAGESGDDTNLPTQVGIGRHVRRHRDTFPAIVVFPQAAREAEWHWYAPVVFAQIDAVLEEFHGDPERVSVTGLSVGGTGAIDLVLADPSRFAALAVVCGPLRMPSGVAAADDASLRQQVYLAAAQQLRHTPIWLFHGARDDVAPPETSRAFFDALKLHSTVDVRYKEFENANHNSWDPAYQQTVELYPWLMEQRRR